MQVSWEIKWSCSHKSAFDLKIARILEELYLWFVRFKKPDSISHDADNEFRNEFLSDQVFKWYSFMICKKMVTGILVQISPCVQRVSVPSLTISTYRSVRIWKLTFKLIFPDSRFIVGLSWLRTCRTQMILWYWLTVYSDWPSRKEEK